MTDLAHRIDAASDAFELEWQTGQRPNIDLHLEAFVGVERALVLRELIRLDIEFRWRSGESVRIEDYLTRYPNLALDRVELLELITFEQRMRLACRQPVPLEEYLDRFPEFRQELLARFAKSGSRIPEIPGYQLLQEVGRGGMGVVYRARDAKLDRVVAIKQILHGGDQEEVARFRREAEVIARVDHPGIVKIFEVGEHDGVPFMALEFCAGGNLATRLAASPLTSKQAAQLVEGLAQAAAAAHAVQVVHRDLKPANVLLVGADDGTLRAKISDFGLAKRMDQSVQTRTGQALGTPAYMSPEQAATEREIGPSSDIRALGVILYECLTGRPPFRAATPLSTLRLILESDPAPPRELQPDIPRDLETICLKCLRKDPKARYENAQSLAQDLGRFLAGEPIQARPVGVLERTIKRAKRNRGIAVPITAIFTIALLAIGLAVQASFEADRANREAKRAGHEAKRADDEAVIAKGRAAEAVAARKDAEKSEQLVKAEAFKTRAVQQGLLNTLTLDAWEKKNERLASFYLNQTSKPFDQTWEHRHLRKLLKRMGPVSIQLPGLASDPDPDRYKFEEKYIYPLAWNAAGNQVMVASGSQICSIDAITGNQTMKQDIGLGNARALVWSPSGKKYAVSGYEGPVVIYETESGKKIQTLNFEFHPFGIVWSPDESQLAIHHLVGGIKIWDVATGTTKQTLPTGGYGLHAFSPDGQKIAYRDRGSIAVWDIANNKPYVVLDRPENATFSTLAWLPDGDHIVIDTHVDINQNGVELWNIKTRKREHIIAGFEDETVSLSASSDGTLLAVGGRYGSLGICDSIPGQ
jgi:tRNA A-37 threonylcarbamoyl transferase component Bud32